MRTADKGARDSATCRESAAIRNMSWRSDSALCSCMYWYMFCNCKEEEEERTGSNLQSAVNSLTDYDRTRRIFLIRILFNRDPNWVLPQKGQSVSPPDVPPPLRLACVSPVNLHHVWILMVYLYNRSQMQRPRRRPLDRSNIRSKSSSLTASPSSTSCADDRGTSQPAAADK